MLHHTERVGLSCRINKGGLAAGVGDAQLTVEDISACSYNNRQEYRVKCHENSARREQWCGAMGAKGER